MAGRCFGCGDEFGFFKREHDCGNCGRIFCSKCTSNSIVVPSKGKKAVNVCSNCYQALTSLSKKKQLAHDLSQPSKILHSQSRKSSLPDRRAKSDNVQFDPDEDIRKRLEKLKQPDKSSNHNDVMDKFQNLTGRAPVSAQTTNINTTGPKKTESEQISDLMKQMNDECNLDDRSGYEEKSEVTDEDIERRLDILKGRETKNNSGPSKRHTKPSYDYDSDDEAEFRRKYIQQAIAESFLDDKVREGGYGDVLDKANQKLSSKEYQPVVDPDELPWCCICNEDAALRCHGCDEDLYCKQCYREGHSGEDYEDHITSPYRPPTQPR